METYTSALYEAAEVLGSSGKYSLTIETLQNIAEDLVTKELTTADELFERGILTHYEGAITDVITYAFKGGFFAEIYTLLTGKPSHEIDLHTEQTLIPKLAKSLYKHMQENNHDGF